MFLSLDGVDGTGKTTQIALLCDWLRSTGHDVVTCRDPGSTPLGEAIRQILLNEHELPIQRRSEMLLYMAARAQLVDEVIRPALAAGKTVVSDRYLLANVVYQGHAGGLDAESIRLVGAVATGGCQPDLTIVLDMPPEAAALRIARARDRMEQQGEAFERAVRAGFLAEAARQPERIVVIDANRPIEQVQADIRSAASKVNRS
jgi:dTMP kinase